jgi:hypothetical protein
MKWMRDKGCQSLVVGSDVPSFIYLCQWSTYPTKDRDTSKEFTCT